MESSKRRRIRDGKEFDELFPAPSGTDYRMKKDADVDDTMKLIHTSMPSTLWHTKAIAEKLRGRTLDETCANIWHFVYDHIQYKRDEDGVEQVRSPRRTWWERSKGVDCDCYTEFIGSILLNLGIPHKARITKYPKRPPEIPRWQHVYPIVPRSGKLRGPLRREDYIVLDCVKDEYDSEQPFIDNKDYDMRLDYLDGVDEQDLQDAGDDSDEDVMDLMGVNDIEPDNVDLADLAAIYDDEQMGNIFKKIGKGLKKVASKVKEGLRVINRFVNPATILLRNGFLLAMKLNLFNVAGRLRYAYVTDTQANTLGLNMNTLNKLRKVRERAESIYYQAGGKKENLKKAILNGKGNKDKKVSMSGLFGLDDVYADQDEYDIIHANINGPDDLAGLDGDLGIVATASVAAATSAVAAIAGVLKSIKGLFNKGGKEEASFASETENSTSAAEAANTNASQDESAILAQSSYTDTSNAAPAATPAPQQILPQQFSPQASVQQQSATAANYDETEPQQFDSDNGQASQPALPAAASIARRATSTLVPATQNTAVQTTNAGSTAQPTGFVQKTTAWVKDNPGKTLLIAGGVIGAGVLLAKSMHSKPKGGLNGTPRAPGKKGKNKGTKKNKSKNTQIKRIII
jgi:hypothetical protein